MGPVPARVTTAQGQTALVLVNKQAESPAFFILDPGARHYAAAVFSDGTSLHAQPSPRSDFAICDGFGSDLAAYPDGQLLTRSYPLASNATMRVGGQVDAILYAGLVGPGLYQLNVTVPDVADGYALLTLELAGGAPTTGESFLAIKR